MHNSVLIIAVISVAYLCFRYLKSGETLGLATCAVALLAITVWFLRASEVSDSTGKVLILVVPGLGTGLLYLIRRTVRR
jgi:hypothetical protein